MIEPGEIVYCNLTFVTKSKETVLLKELVFSRPYEGEFKTKYSISSNEDAPFMKRHKINEDATLVKVDVIKHMGYSVDYRNNNNYSSASKSDTDERQKNGSFM